MAPAWARVTMPSALLFLRSGWSGAILTPYHFQRGEGTRWPMPLPFLIGRSHPSSTKTKARSGNGHNLGMGDNALCPSLFEKWLGCGIGS